MITTLDGDTLVLRTPPALLPAPTRSSGWRVRVDGPHPNALDLEDSVPDVKARS